MARPQVTGTQSHLSAWHGSWSFYDERWGDGGAYAQITWRTLTMAIAQPGAVAELRHKRPRHQGCCVPAKPCCTLAVWLQASALLWGTEGPIHQETGLDWRMLACHCIPSSNPPSPHQLYLAIYVMPWRVCCLNVLLWLLPSLTFQNSVGSFPLELRICLPS